MFASLEHFWNDYKPVRDGYRTVAPKTFVIDAKI
jgi:hypothetical protein